MQQPWDIASLSSAPEIFEERACGESGVKAVFYAGLPWKGKPTRVFSYIGAPKTADNVPVPAMVLVHGGGGSAFLPWVKLWIDRGYAAIAMDTCGCISGGGYNNHPHHEYGGPPGWGRFDHIDEPIEDQWCYHAVADIVLAHSLIRSCPGVDPQRVGLTGASWGGYLACIAAGVDERFKLAVPVYGCGFLGDNSIWLSEFQKLGRDKAEKWLELWDPSVYLPNARMPMLWVTGANERHYPLDSFQKSYRLPKSPRTLCVRAFMQHGHGGPAENPEEIHAMANAILNKGKPLARIVESGRTGFNAWSSFESRTPIIRAELNCTTDTGEWHARNWTTTPACMDMKTGLVSATLPNKTTAYYFNFTDDRNLLVSSEHGEIPLKAR